MIQFFFFWLSHQNHKSKRLITIKLSTRLVKGGGLFYMIVDNNWNFLMIQVKGYAELIRVYEEKLSNLTLRVENMEKDTISYTELDFELIKLEVKEMEKLIIEMKNTFIGSSTIIDQLEVEVMNKSTSHCMNINSFQQARSLTRV